MSGRGPPPAFKFSPRRRPAAAPVRVSAAHLRSLVGREQIAQWLRQDRRSRIRRLLLPCARCAGMSRRCGRPRREGGLRAPQRACRHDDGGRLRRIVGDIAGVPCKVKYLVRRCLTATCISPRRIRSAARVAARRHRIGVRVFRRRCGACRPGQHGAGGQAGLAGRDRVATEAFEAFRGAYPAGPSSVRRRRAGRKVPWRRASSMSATWCSGRGPKWRAGRRSTR